jgi:hypothetical protein
VATFNVPTPGAYDWNVAANQNQTILALQPNTIYLIERLSTGADISEIDFLDAIRTLPQLTLRKTQGNRSQTVYALPLRVLNYDRNGGVVAWVYTDRSGDLLTGSLLGVLNQTPALVGRGSVTLNAAFGIYAVEDRNYLVHFREQLSGSIGQSLRM